ncbi:MULTISPECIES: glutathione S-transferase family protein [unclassified Bradyrhizobium]|uniref:glutathione S-transferase family protein n=1 Tax=unclassified Bradyrhizobium TaxID=2631580 RepID=UPI0030CB6A7C
MTADQNALILHQYDISPYSEKIRGALGLKGLTWWACNQPSIMPKPELIALTGGYRRIPVLQIGRDVYCDSELILDEIERRFPAPSIFACGRATAETYRLWADEKLFPTVVGLLFSGDWDVSEAFIADRSALRGRPFDPEAFRAAVPGLTEALHRHLRLLEMQLENGNAFLAGEQPGAADLQVFHNVAFIRWGKGRTTALLDQHPGLRAWEAKMRAIGHGIRHDIGKDDALRVAREAPVSAAVGGARVSYQINDANSPPIAGRLVAEDPQRVSILLENPFAGTVVVHLPTTGGRLHRLD